MSDGTAAHRRWKRPLRMILVHGSASATLLCVACSPRPPPPPHLLFDKLPVSGDLPLARQTGFHDCLSTDAIHIRCRRHGVTLFGQGPYEAAVDLLGADGESGFSLLTVWNDEDQDAIYKLVVPLERGGWTYCYTGTEQWGDQAIFTKPGQPVWLSMDISYYGKRRLRVLPNWNRQGLGKPCTPDDSVFRFGVDVAKAAAE